jgi:thiol:disulfide interchange protein
LAALVAIFGSGLAIWTTRTWPSIGGKAAAALIAFVALTWAGFSVSAAQPAPSQSAADEGRWSVQRVQDLQAQGKTVFVNFTADWCVTCKVNEVSVFSNARVKAALSGDKAVYLVADWTNRDEAIRAALASHGRIGVPLYLVYKPSTPEPIILPQILSAQTVLSALD